MNRAITPLLLVFMAVILAVVGPSIDDRSGEFAAADDAIAQIKRENHIAAAGKKVCGENAAWQIEGNTIQCFTHRGKKTITAKVTP